MARPVEKRDAKRWHLEVAALTRLRSAVQLESGLKSEETERICGEIDAVLKSIVTLMKKK